jgi:hypothetical protein
MRLPVVIGALVVLASLAAASAATAHSPHGVSTFFEVRRDARLCPSPACGGWFVSRVNRSMTDCAPRRTARECYVAELELGLLRLSAAERASLERALATGRALLRGSIVPLPRTNRWRRLLVLEGWVGYGKGTARQPIRRLEDNGVRCVTTPCFSLHASVLNGTAHEDVSGIDLDNTGAPRSVVERALNSLTTTSVLAAGPTLPADDGGRAVVAQRFWLLATRPPER